MILENLRQVEANIQEACKKAGRAREEVTLIAVSKTKPVSMLMEAYNAGIRPSETSGEYVIYNVMAKRDSLKVSFRPLDLLSGVAEDVHLTGPATFVAEVIVSL